MYKLTVIAGPNRGTSYAIQSGENAIGRQSGNVVVLQSSRVSKRHCTLIVDNDKIMVRDEGSSNGTFINGVMAKMKSLVPGDRISVGEFVLELRKPSVRAAGAAPALQGLGNNVVQFPGLPAVTSGEGGGLDSMGAYSQPAHAQDASAMPASPLGKLNWLFDRKVMPVFYGIILKNEWRFACISLIGVMVAASVLLTLQPMLESARNQILTELSHRARFIAQEIAEINAPILQNGVRAQTRIPTIRPYLGVSVAALVDLDNNNVIAANVEVPGGTLKGPAGRMASVFSKVLRNGKLRQGEDWIARPVDENTVVAVEPVRVYHANQGRETIEALAVVSINSELFTAGVGEIGMAYAQSLVLTGAVAAIILLVLYRLTLKPFLVLNDDIDKVLKGDIPQVTQEFKFEELNALWTIINSALQRVPKAGEEGQDGQGGATSGGGIEEALGAIRLLGDIGKMALVACDGDRKVVFQTQLFEEVTGIRSENSQGQPLTEVSRDQAFSALVTDLFDRAMPGGESVGEDMDFSGVPYRVQVAAVGQMGYPARGFVMSATRQDG